MSKKTKTNLIILVVLTVLGYVGGAALCYFLERDTSITFAQALTNWEYVGIGAGTGLLLGLVYLFMSKPKKKEENKSQGKTASGQEMSLSYDAQWLKPEDIANQKGLIATTWSHLPSLKNTGIVFRNQIENGKYQIAMKDEYHCLIIGTTASGKTSACLVLQSEFWDTLEKNHAWLSLTQKANFTQKQAEFWKMKDIGF